MNEPTCRDYGHVQGCQMTPDPKYDIHPPAGSAYTEVLHFCAHCGPERLALIEMVMLLWDSGDAAMKAKIEKLIDDAEAQMTTGAS